MTMLGKLVWEADIPGQHPVRLYQTKTKRFTVVYGKAVKEKLTYSDATHELGISLMHALACAFLLDNDGP